MPERMVVDIMPPELGSSISLPYSRQTLFNRLVKVAMAECLADYGGGSPNESHRRLYGSWAEGGWGMVITGRSFLVRSSMER